jgi:cytochrome P450
MDAAEGPELTTEALATRVLVINAATIQTSSMVYLIMSSSYLCANVSKTFTQALTNLALYPEYLEPLRREAEAALRKHGWNKAAMNELQYLDSFFKESMRMNSLGSSKCKKMLVDCLKTHFTIVGFPRKALKAFTFSDGTHVPKGSYVSAAFATHRDEEYYENPNTFEGFRFFKDGMVKTSSRFLSFGHGKHAW